MAGGNALDTSVMKLPLELLRRYFIPLTLFTAVLIKYPFMALYQFMARICSANQTSQSLQTGF